MTLTHLILTVDLPGSLSREAVLERRDELVDALTAAGCRLSFTVCGTDVYLVDGGVPTVSDTLAEMGRSDADEERQSAADALAERCQDTIDRAVADGHLPG